MMKKEKTPIILCLESDLLKLKSVSSIQFQLLIRFRQLKFESMDSMCPFLPFLAAETKRVGSAREIQAHCRALISE